MLRFTSIRVQLSYGRVLSLLMLIGIFSEAPAQYLKLSTSAQAEELYREGWHQIMNNGNYSYAEALYREMVAVDANFLVGLSLVARISKDAKERITIATKLKDSREMVTGDERKLLDIYIGLIELTNAREESIDSVRMTKMRNAIFENAYEGLKHITGVYQGEVYYLAEYIEVVHYLFGAAAAIEVFESIEPSKNKMTPFIWGFAALLYSELGEFEMAEKMAVRLEGMVKTNVPKPWVTWGRLYYDRGEFEQALFLTDRALMYDLGNIDAQRLKATILKEM